MTLVEYLEKDKDKLLASLSQASTPERALSVIEAEYDRLLYEYNENASSDYERRLAAGMLQTAQIATPLLDCIGDTKIWEQGGKLLNDEKKQVRFSAFLLIIAGLVLLGGVLIVLNGIDDLLNELVDRPVLIAGIAGAAACLFLAGLFFVRKKNASYSEKQYKAENRIDHHKIYQTMRAILMLVDRNIRDALNAEELEKQKREDGKDPVQEKNDYSLYSDLLEAGRSKDGEYALDQLSKLPFYLHQKGIDVLEYSEDNRTYFDMIPGEKEETIRPALLKDGHLLKKGIVSGGRS